MAYGPRASLILRPLTRIGLTAYDAARNSNREFHNLLKKMKFSLREQGGPMEWTRDFKASIRVASLPRGLVIFSSEAVLYALLIALSARLSLPIPGTPVPATLQTLAVLLAGALLGPWGGVASVAAYLAAGAAGAPVFASGGGAGFLVGPTGGYLLSFLPAAWLSGSFAARNSRFRVLFPGLLLAVAVIHLSGWAQLSLMAGAGPAASLGVAPFLAFDVLKALVAAMVAARFRGKALPASVSCEENTR